MVSRLALIFAILIAGLSVADAKPKHTQAQVTCDRQGCRATADVTERAVFEVKRGPASGHRHAPALSHSDPRPAKWCGWQMRQWFGVADRAFNIARKWAGYGTRASGPAPGVIAVYPHHVGIVVSVPGPGRMVMKSGNDGHAVRTRERSTRGVIAWRNPPQRYAGL